MTQPTIGSPLWWLAKLNKALTERQATTRRLNEYYEGKHPLAFATEPFREAFGGLFDAFADNWCELVVDAVAERLFVTGFRREGAEDADQQAHEIWKRNQLDSESGQAFVESLVTAWSYMLVWPTRGEARITVEHPMQVITARSAADPRTVAAALKRYRDTDGYHIAYLYLPNKIYRFRSKSRSGDHDHEIGSNIVWEPEPRKRAEDPAEQPNPFAPIVPMVPFPNKPRLLGGARSEIANVIPMQDAVNKIWADMMLASEFAADAQRVILGYEEEFDEKTNQPKPPPFKRKDRIWGIPFAEDSEGRLQLPKVEQFAAAPLDNYVKAVETAVQHIAAQTRTPPHYLLGNSGAFPSGESLKATETGLVAKTRQKQLHWGQSLEVVMSLALRAEGSGTGMLETIWQDPESQSDAELVDSLTKMVALGMPNEAAWERYGATPQEIRQWKAQQAQQDILGVINAAAAAEDDDAT